MNLTNAKNANWKINSLINRVNVIIPFKYIISTNYYDN